MAEKGVESWKGEVTGHSHKASKPGRHQASGSGSADFKTRVLNCYTIWPKRMVGKKRGECKVTHTLSRGVRT